MSCILDLFRKKTEQPKELWEAFLDGPLPENEAQLSVMEEKLSRRLSFVNRKASLAQTNALYSESKGDILRSLRYVEERQKHSKEVERLSKRLIEIVEKQIEFTYMPPLALPPPAEVKPQQENIS